MEEKAHLAAELDSAREMMNTALADMGGQRDLNEDWTLKELLAHIAGWDEYAIGVMEAVMKGGSFDDPLAGDFDAFNARSIARRQRLNFEEIIRDWNGTRQRLKRVLREISPEKLALRMDFPWNESGSLSDLIEILVHHEAWHAQDTRQKKAA